MLHICFPAISFENVKMHPAEKTSDYMSVCHVFLLFKMVTPQRTLCITGQTVKGRFMDWTNWNSHSSPSQTTASSQKWWTSNQASTSPVFHCHSSSKLCLASVYHIISLTLWFWLTPRIWELYPVFQKSAFLTYQAPPWLCSMHRRNRWRQACCWAGQEILKDDRSYCWGNSVCNILWPTAASYLTLGSSQQTSLPYQPCCLWRTIETFRDG